MPVVPRIVRAVPKGSVNRRDPGLPVLATIRWHDGHLQHVFAIATAWTNEAVELSWEEEIGSGLRSDWIPIADVRSKPSTEMTATLTPAELPPHTRSGEPRRRW